MKRFYRTGCVDKVLNQAFNTLPLMRSIDLAHPSIKRLSSQIALAHVVVFVSVLCYFIVVGTQNEISRQYLSITAPDKSSAHCKDVPVPVTAVFMADVNGVWETQPGYIEAKRLFQLTFVGSKVNSKLYTKVLGNLGDSLKSAGERAKGSVLGTLMVASLFKARDVPNGMTLSTTVNFMSLVNEIGFYPQFDKPWFSSAAGVCIPSEKSSLSSEIDRQILTVSIPKLYTTKKTDHKPSDQSSSKDLPSERVYTNPCPGQLNIPKEQDSDDRWGKDDNKTYGSFGFGGEGPDTPYTVSFDLIPVLTAWALTTQRVTPADVVMVPKITNLLSYGQNFSMKQYNLFDFPDKPPTECLTLNSYWELLLALYAWTESQATAAYPKSQPVLPFIFSTQLKLVNGTEVPIGACECPNDFALFHSCYSGKSSVMAIFYPIDIESPDDVEIFSLRLEQRRRESQRQRS
jgi:hypothetical protein